MATNDLKEILAYFEEVSNREYMRITLTSEECKIILKEIERLKEENKDLKIFISNYVDRLEHILENGSKKFIRENLNLVIEYMNDYLYEIIQGEDK